MPPVVALGVRKAWPEQQRQSQCIPELNGGAADRRVGGGGGGAAENTINKTERAAAVFHNYTHHAGALCAQQEENRGPRGVTTGGQRSRIISESFSGPGGHFEFMCVCMSGGEVRQRNTDTFAHPWYSNPLGMLACLLACLPGCLSATSSSHTYHPLAGIIPKGERTDGRCPSFRPVHSFSCVSLCVVDTRPGIRIPEDNNQSRRGKEASTRLLGARENHKKCHPIRRPPFRRRRILLVITKVQLADYFRTELLKIV